jgi:Zn finger protein HypA/HybF involved in hydrogenase expression
VTVQPGQPDQHQQPDISQQPDQPGQHQYACPSCGAALEFAPGTAGMVCPYCEAKLGIDLQAAGSPKNDYVAYAGQAHTPVAQLPAFSVACHNCGSAKETTSIAGRCPSCRGPVVVSDDLGGQLKSPDGVVPFVVDKDKAVACFREWTTSRWFAPSALKKVGSTDSMSGSYLPHWGFDDSTTTEYTGQRGDHYYTTETYTTQENGQTVTNTRQVQHTSWSHASGRVARDFVDVLATGVSAPGADLLEKLGPWPTASATGYRSEYLAGFDSPRYDIDADVGFASAKHDMAAVIEGDCRADIGGDEQRVEQMSTDDRDVLFRLLLLPLWIATYITGGKTFHVYVNANTGEVIGERPYSALKIVAAVMAVVVAIATAYLIYNAQTR